jgi:hypothetical protein
MESKSFYSIVFFDDEGFQVIKHDFMTQLQVISLLEEFRSNGIDVTINKLDGEGDIVTNCNLLQSDEKTNGEGYKLNNKSM